MSALLRASRTSTRNVKGEMRRIIWATVLFSILAALAYASPAQASVTSSGQRAIPLLHEGQVCVKVHSQNNWRGQICAIVNEDDAQLDHSAQALITFDINSGTLKEVYVGGGLYLRDCLTGPPFTCTNRAYRQSPHKFTGGKHSFISNAFFWVNGDNVQARVNTPCMIWTNGQVACYNGVLRTPWIQVGIPGP
jgi:hypothetical protein